MIRLVELKFKSIKIFKNVVNIIKDCLEEVVNFEINETGFGIVAMDESHVSMIDFFMPKDAFSNFNYIPKKTKKKGKKKELIGLNLGKLNEILKRIDANDTVILKTDIKQSKVHLETGIETKTKFSLNMIDLAEETYPEPKSNVSAGIIFNNPKPIKKFENINIFSDHVTIEAKQEKGLSLFGKGDNGEALVEFAIDSEDIEFQINANCKTLYPLSYLLKILKLVPITQKLNMSFSEDNPILIQFILDEDNLIRLNFWLSPRIEEEEGIESELDELEEQEEEELPDES